MTNKIETEIVQKKSSRWQRLQAWYTAFDQAMDYDPQAYTDEMIKQIREVLVKHESRLLELEGSNQRVLVSNTIDPDDGEDLVNHIKPFN